MSGEDVLERPDNDGMLATAAASSRVLSDSNSAFGFSSQRTWLTSHRPLAPFHRHRCSSESGFDKGRFGWSVTAHYRSCTELDGCVRTVQSAATASTFHRPAYRLRRHLTTINPLQRKDIFYGGSVVSLRSSTVPGGLHSRPNVHLAGVEVLDPVEEPSVAAGQTRTRSRCGERCSTLLVMLDMSLFGNCAFLVICSASAFIQLGYFVPIVFLTPYIQTLQLTTSDAAVFLSVIGISNMIGRAGAGALATIPKVNILQLNNMSLVVTGLSTALVTVLCTSYASLIVYAVVFGLSIAVFVPLMTLFLVKYIGLDRLTNAYGLLSMIKGLATMAGPPIAGALLDATQSYSSAFYFAAAMFTTAGLMFYLLPLTQRLK